LGSAYLETLLQNKGKKEFVKEIRRFVKQVASARRKGKSAAKNNP
jgi:hypothetical protein